MTQRKIRYKYGLNPGKFLPVSAEVAGRQLEKIRKEQGSLTPEIVVKDAKSPSSPIHPCFTWDVRAAAEERWIDQARYLLRSITIEISSSDGDAEPTSVRAFQVVGASEDDGRSYHNVIEIMGNADMLAQVVERAKAEAESWRQRYLHLRHLSEIRPIIAAIERVVVKRQVQRKQRQRRVARG